MKITFIVALLLGSLSFAKVQAQEVGKEMTEEDAKAYIQAKIDSVNDALKQQFDELNERARSVQVHSICGVKFGTSRQEAQEVLRNKFGKEDYISSTENRLYYKNQNYAGINFGSIIFLFQADYKSTYLSTCIFVKEAKSFRDAKEKQKELASILEDKYAITWSDEETDEPMFSGGVSPLWTESMGIFSAIGSGFHSDIIKYDIEGIDYTYGVRLIYGPYDYVKDEF